jgi:hypothetical protein
MRRRIIASTALGMALLLGVGFAPAAQAKAVRTNSGRAVHASRVVHPGVHAVPHSITVYPKPKADYVDNTCDIDLSSIPDFTTLTSVTGCGVTVSFSTTMEKLSVPNSWSTWGSPPQTESASPNILWSDGATDVVVTYSSASRRIGFEVEPDIFQAETINATFTAVNGTSATIARTPNGSAGALLYALKTPKKAKKHVNKIEVVDTAGDDFAIAQIRVHN